MDYKKHTKERFLERFPNLGELTDEEYEYLHQLGCRKVLSIDESGKRTWSIPSARKKAYKEVVSFKEEKLCIVFNRNIVKTVYPPKKSLLKKLELIEEQNHYKEI